MKKIIKNLVFVLAIVIIITLILLINNNGNGDEATMQCIASKSTLFVTKTCGHCALQKKIIGEEHLPHFKIVDCTTNKEECTQAQITGVPTWIINGEKYPGKKSIKNLKKITGC